MALAMVLSACGAGAGSSAAKAVAAFLAAAQRGDRPAVEAALDRDALREDLKGQLGDVARSHGVEVDGGASEFVLDRMISPNAFRLVSVDGQPLAAPPTPAQVAPLLKSRDRNQVCLQDLAKQRCLLDFARHKGVWRLVGMQATGQAIVLAAPK